MGGSRARKLPKVLSREEVAALMARPNLACPTGLRDRCMLELMYRCGLRVSETCGLHLRDIRWQEGIIHLRPEVAKGGREAVVYLDEPTEVLLRRWIEVRRRYAAGKPHLFTTLKGGQMSRHCVWEMTARRARRADIRHTSPHMLRHTYATQLLGDGFNIVEVQKLMRHSAITTTTVYLHLQDVELQRKIRARS